MICGNGLPLAEHRKDTRESGCVVTLEGFWSRIGASAVEIISKD